jgi:pimeloyl-ACP methyl ester carboxylesterase
VTRQSQRDLLVLYLHGFASSAKSTKAGFFAERLAAHGVSLACPDFNEPDFRTLTMTRMLDRLVDEVGRAAGRPVVLFGSSLGGTLAILAASRLGDRLARVVLLAPAVMFAKPGHHLLPPERIEEWRRKGELPFFHYGENATRPLAFAFYEDTLKYDAFTAPLVQPTMIFQGVRDQSVDYRTVEAFAAARPNVTLSLLDDDHSLVTSLPRIWNDVEPFLELIRR